jgi:hypothetical protein
MRHVTDGELHAFLDGGLDSLPEDRAEEIRAHLDSCDACRERLQDEDAVRISAEEILGAPSLDRTSLPTFEELRQRAEAPGPLERAADAGRSEPHYRGPLRGLPLAWAATIVLALGVGWMGGQVWRGLPSDSPGSRYEPIELQAVQRADLEDALLDTGAVPGQVEGENLEETSEGNRPRPASERVDQAAGERPAGPPPEPVASNPVEAGAAVVGSSAPDSTALAVSAVSPARTGEGIALKEVIVPATEARRAGTLQTDLPRSLSAPGGSNPPVPAGTDNSLAIPGLRVVAIEWEERVPGEKALLIRQLLPPGDTLELRYLGMLLGSDPEPRIAQRPGVMLEEEPRARRYANVLEASLPPGWSQVVMEWNRGLLVARGPIPDRNLKALLKTLKF